MGTICRCSLCLAPRCSLPRPPDRRSQFECHPDKRRKTECRCRWRRRRLPAIAYPRRWGMPKSRSGWNRLRLVAHPVEWAQLHQGDAVARRHLAPANARLAHAAQIAVGKPDHIQAVHTDPHRPAADHGPHQRAVVNGHGSRTQFRDQSCDPLIHLGRCGAIRGADAGHVVHLDGEIRAGSSARPGKGRWMTREGKARTSRRKPPVSAWRRPRSRRSCSAQQRCRSRSRLRHPLRSGPTKYASVHRFGTRRRPRYW